MWQQPALIYSTSKQESFAIPVDDNCWLRLPALQASQNDEYFDPLNFIYNLDFIRAHLFIMIEEVPVSLKYLPPMFLLLIRFHLCGMAFQSGIQ